MSPMKKYPFYKHLITMQCRKDILLENDFTNTRTKNINTPFFEKYKSKFTKNQMRLAYLAGFCVVFNLGFAYDYFFQSGIYRGIVDRTERFFSDVEENITSKEVDYRKREANELGKYFIKLEKLNQTKQITPSLLSGRIPVFSGMEGQALDVNAFVKFCLVKKISPQELPSPYIL